MRRLPKGGGAFHLPMMQETDAQDRRMIKERAPLPKAGRTGPFACIKLLKGGNTGLCGRGH